MIQRWLHRYGFGIQSPWAYELVRNVLFEPLRYYAFDELKAKYDCIDKPHNLSPKYWIGINPKMASDDLLWELTRNSYEIVKNKYKRQK